MILLLLIIIALAQPFDSRPPVNDPRTLAHPSTSLGMTLSRSKGQGRPDVDAEVRRIAMEGWRAARAIAPKGGAVELLGPVNVSLKQLDEIPRQSARYAETAIRAAVSAAQEERDEMALLLEHARSLSDLMGLGGNAPAEWPLPIDELEGELLLEVDRYADARDAYDRATRVKPTPNAWVGLARSADKLGDRVTACRAYASAATTPNLPASVELEVSIYRLKCK